MVAGLFGLYTCLRREGGLQFRLCRSCHCVRHGSADTRSILADIFAQIRAAAHLFYGYLMCGLTTIFAGLLGKVNPFLSVVLLIGGAFAISSVDSGGNAPFLRAARPHQRVKWFLYIILIEIWLRSLRRQFCDCFISFRREICISLNWSIPCYCLFVLP